MTYEFIVEARNQLYYSAISDPVSILCATLPEVPGAPTTENQADDVVISWIAPVNNGLEITAYTVMIRKSDSDFAQDLINCDGTLSGIVSSKTCTLSLTTLTAAPYLLLPSEEVFVKVSATNAYGTTAYSEVGNGAYIQFVPDAPINLVDVPEITSATQIGLSW